MVFSAYLGPEAQLPTWLDAVERHAAWLGLAAHHGKRRVGDAQVFAFCHLTAGPAPAEEALRDDSEHLVMTTSLAPPRVREWDRLAEIDDNRIALGVDLRGGEIRVAVPPTTPDQFYHRHLGGALVLANDLRVLMRWAPSTLDERGVYALLQYGAIPAPLTPSRDVGRVPNGHLATFSPRSPAPVLRPCYDLAEESRPLRAADAVGELWRCLDRTLAALPPATVVYFSGGVDSGLMAARLAALGRTDVTLFNYSFGPHDQEADLALRMAAHLGLRCEQVTYDPGDLPGLMERLARDYAFPFSDISVIPTNLLVHASLPLVRSAGTALEGTGADGTFGLGLKRPQWTWVYRVPRFIRQAAGASYGTFGLWRSENIAGQVTNIARRSVQMPLDEAAVVAHNALDGIAFTMPPGMPAAFDEVFRSGVHVISRGLEPRDCFSFLDMVHVCCGMYAVKAFEPLRSRGMETVFPFLEPSLLRAGFAISWEEKCAGGVAKRLLKDRLVQSVPHDMVFRPKRGFRPPLTAIFATPAMQDFIAGVVMPQSNPLLAFCERRVLAAIVERTRRSVPLSTGVYQFLWSMIFFSGWLQQLKPATR